MRKGGTVGDIESAPFIHAISQLQRRAGKGNFVQIHVSYVPMIPYVLYLELAQFPKLTMP